MYRVFIYVPYHLYIYIPNTYVRVTYKAVIITIYSLNVSVTILLTKYLKKIILGINKTRDPLFLSNN